MFDRCMAKNNIFWQKYLVFQFFKDFEEKLMRFETKDINATESVWLSATPSNR